MISTRGGDLYVRSWGAPDGQAVVMIHGTTSHLGEFEVSLGPTLERRYRLLAYDRPGMGRSTRRAADAEKLAVQAEAAADVMRAEGLSRAVIVGHSYGGAVALRLALDHPELVSGLVLLAPATHAFGGAPVFVQLQATPVLGQAIALAGWPIAGAFARASLDQRAFAPKHPPENYFERAEVALALRPGALYASAQDYAAMDAELAAQAPRYGELKLPIAVIVGAEDHIIPHREGAPRDLHPFALSRVDVLPGVGHMPQHADPDLVARDIDWVLTQAAPKPAPTP